MNEAIAQMLKKYHCANRNDYENALKEIIQEIALLGLWRTKFFEHAAFYGGTALRIIYGLDRFSEDMDFSLLKKNLKFDLKKYNQGIKDELESYGFKVTVQTKKKSNASTAIESAFIKAGTLFHLLEIEAPKSVVGSMASNHTLKIKLEVDKDPPLGFATEAKLLLMPNPFYVNTFQMPDLFAGKMHAVLCRNWQTRVKGRDFYDLSWYIARQTPLHLQHLEKRMQQSGHWPKNTKLSKVKLLNLLAERFAKIDFNLAKKDILPFLKNVSLDIWSKGYFLDLVQKIQTS